MGYLKKRNIILMLCIGALIISCRHMKITVVERGGAEIILQHAQLSTGSSLTVRHGDALRRIPLRMIKELHIDSRGFDEQNGEIFYRCMLVLVNGELIPGKSGDSENETISHAYISVSEEIVGKGVTGSLTIPLDKVAKVIIEKDK